MYQLNRFAPWRFFGINWKYFASEPRPSLKKQVQDAHAFPFAPSLLISPGGHKSTMRSPWPIMPLRQPGRSIRSIHLGSNGYRWQDSSLYRHLQHSGFFLSSASRFFPSFYHTVFPNLFRGPLPNALRFFPPRWRQDAGNLLLLIPLCKIMSKSKTVLSRDRLILAGISIKLGVGGSLSKYFTQTEAGFS